MAEYLFVYGTLLPELVPASVRDLVSELRPVGAGSLPGRLYDLPDYPGALVDDGSDERVFGRVFGLPAAETIPADLDEYEGYDPGDVARSLFVRVRRTVALADGTVRSCWVYAYNRDPTGWPVVPGGDYLARKRALSPGPALGGTP